MAIHPSLLLQFGLLKALPADAVQRLATASDLHEFARREVVLDKGAPVEHLCFLLEGRLQATDFTLDGREVALNFVEPGQYFGEVALLDGKPSAEILIATRKAQVVRVPAALMRPLLLQEPALTEAVMLGLARKVREHSEQRQILGINNPLQRVCALVLVLVRRTTGVDPSAQPARTVDIAEAPTHQELAMMLNLSRETVTRVFQVLQATHALDRKADGLLVDVQQIAKLARQSDA